MSDTILSVNILENHVKDGIVKWRRNEFHGGTTNLAPEDAILGDVTGNLPDPEDRKHPFNRFLNAVASDLAGIFSGDPEALFQQLCSYSERWRTLLLTSDPTATRLHALTTADAGAIHTSTTTDDVQATATQVQGTINSDSAPATTSDNSATRGTVANTSSPVSNERDALPSESDAFPSYPHWPRKLNGGGKLGVCPWRQACQVLGSNGWGTSWGSGDAMYQYNHAGPALTKLQMKRFAAEHYGWKAPSHQDLLLSADPHAAKDSEPAKKPTRRGRTELAALVMDADSKIRMQVAELELNHETRALGSKAAPCERTTRLRPRGLTRQSTSSKPLDGIGGTSTPPAQRQPSPVEWNDVENDLFFDLILKIGATKKQDDKWTIIANSINTKKPACVEKRLKYFLLENGLRIRYQEYCKRKGISHTWPPRATVRKHPVNVSEKEKAGRIPPTKSENVEHRGWTDDENNLFFDLIISKKATKNPNKAWTDIINAIPTKKPEVTRRRLYAFLSGHLLQQTYKEYCERRGIEYVCPPDRNIAKRPLDDSDEKDQALKPAAVSASEQQKRRKKDMPPRKPSWTSSTSPARCSRPADRTQRASNAVFSTIMDAPTGEVDLPNDPARSQRVGVKVGHTARTGHTGRTPRAPFGRAQACRVPDVIESAPVNSRETQRSYEESRRKDTRARIQRILLDRRQTLGQDRNLQDHLSRELEAEIERIDRELLQLYLEWERQDANNGFSFLS
jgi:hypothetical protein